MKPRMGNIPARAGAALSLVTLLLALCAPLYAGLTFKKTGKEKIDARADYLHRMQQSQGGPGTAATTGSLWIPDGALTELASDYKASRLYDPVIITVIEQTAVQASGNVSGDRSLAVNSAITSVGGMSPLQTNPLLSASSSNKLKGSGQTAAASSIRTSLSGQIIAVLPNGSLVVEAQRQLAMNNQKENMIVRGVLRPGDITQDNRILSTSLMNLEVELKGKGVISDYTRPMNPVTRAIMWVLGF